MGEAGVIALDPARMGQLEVYLQGLADGCRRRAGRVAEAVAGSGVSAAHPVSELERLAVVCQREREEVGWRRAAVEALPYDLPRPPRTFTSPAAIVAAAQALARQVRSALTDHPPQWTRLVALLAELDRGGSPTFDAAFLATLGPVPARKLPLVLERAWSERASPGLLPTEGMRHLAAHAALADAVRSASRVRGPLALGERWCRTYADLPPGDAELDAAEEAATPAQRSDADQAEEALRGLGYGLGLAATLARAVGWRRVAGVLTVDRGVVGLVTAPLALADGDGIACDGPEALFGTAAAALTVVGPVAPATAVPALALGALAALFGRCERQPARTGVTRPTPDPVTGQGRLPSGHASNPRVDTAGVPLPPSYG
ncbi:MAG TPA: hypothetical protein VFU19_21050 [Iamia sp.]|nr:hypothetical protein [Iamia sp.]